MIDFFSVHDKVRNADGHMQVASSLPAWYFDREINKLDEEAKSLKRRLDSGNIPRNAEGRMTAKLRKMEKKLSDLQNSKPKLDGQITDHLAKVHKELSGTLKEVMFTRTEDQKGTSNDAVLADRMSIQCIPVSDEVASLAVRNGIPVSSDKKMTLTDMTLIFKPVAKLLGRDTNVESLRRDK